MIDTPRTDELARRDFVPDGLWIKHARDLERESAALRAAAAIEEERSLYWRAAEDKLKRENAALRGEVEWRTKRMEILSDGLQGVSDVLKKTINKIAEDALQSDESKLIDAKLEKEAQP